MGETVQLECQTYTEGSKVTVSKEKLWGLTQPSSTALTRDIPTMVDILHLDPVSGWVDFLRISQNSNKGIHICLLTLSHTSYYAAFWVFSSSLLNTLMKIFNLILCIKVFLGLSIPNTLWSSRIFHVVVEPWLLTLFEGIRDYNWEYIIYNNIYSQLYIITIIYNVVPAMN